MVCYVEGMETKQNQWFGSPRNPRGLPVRSFRRLIQTFHKLDHFVIITLHSSFKPASVHFELHQVVHQVVHQAVTP